MNTDVFKRLEGYAGDQHERRSAIWEYLHSLGIKPTDEYIAVLEYLFTNRDHPGAEEIYSGLKSSLRGLTRTKIYTMLDVLSRFGAIGMLKVGKHDMYYDADTTPHGHFICNTCGGIMDVYIGSNAGDTVQLPAGAVLHEIQLTCVGECKLCRDQQVH